MKILPAKYNFWNITYELCTKSINLLGIFFKRKERKRLIFVENHSSIEERRGDKVIFIIGAPRTGSTFLYQYITSRYNVLYFNNIVDIFHKFTLTGFDISKKFFGDKAHNCYRSNHGATLRYGLNAPSECGNFWYRNIGLRSYYVAADDVPSDRKQYLARLFKSLVGFYRKPIVIKNLANSLRLSLIKDVFPNAKFIIINRSLLETKASIIKARRKNGTRKNEFWSIYAPELENKQFNSESDMVEAQIKSIQDYIKTGINQFDKRNVLTISYEQLISRDAEFFKTLDKFIGTPLRKDFQEPIERSRK